LPAADSRFDIFSRRSTSDEPFRDAPATKRTLAMFGVQQANAPGHVLCCMCGCGIAPNPAGMCVDCIRTQVRT